MEDDPAVRRVTRAALERCGYSVVDAADGPEALRELAPDLSFDLLLTDVVMARMSGRELADRVLAGKPLIKVLYMSAHADDVLEPHGILTGRFNIVRKPFTPAELSERVSEVLHGGKEPKAPA